MRFLSTKAHGAMDYLGGLMLLVVPLLWLNDDSVPEAAVWTPVAIGALMLAQSLFTDYEFSLANVIPMPAHLTMDVAAGVFLAASPWLFNFADVVWAPHLMLGLLEVGAALMTKTHRDTIDVPRPGAPAVA